MIDEVHLLNEENRGSTLEVIVCIKHYLFEHELCPNKKRCWLYVQNSLSQKVVENSNQGKSLKINFEFLLIDHKME